MLTIICTVISLTGIVFGLQSRDPIARSVSMIGIAVLTWLCFEAVSTMMGASLDWRSNFQKAVGEIVVELIRWGGRLMGLAWIALAISNMCFDLNNRTSKEDTAETHLSEETE